MSWDGVDVVAAAVDWVYVPENALRHLSDEYSLVGYPEHWAMPTQIVRVRSERPATDLLAEAASVCRSWGRTSVAWWIDPYSRPADLEATLRACGRLVETVTVLAYDMTAGVPDCAVPADVVGSVATDLEGLRDYAVVNAEVWGGPVPDDAELTAQLSQDGVRAVAYVGGAPVASGGLSVVDGVARLWGGATLPTARRRGGYRAVLQARLRHARSRGATLALVKGRVETSAPILSRLGFMSYGEERAYELPA